MARTPPPTPVERAPLLLWGLLGAQPGEVSGLLFLFPPPNIEHLWGRSPTAGGRPRGRFGNGSVPPRWCARQALREHRCGLSSQRPGIVSRAITDVNISSL